MPCGVYSGWQNSWIVQGRARGGYVRASAAGAGGIDTTDRRQHFRGDRRVQCRGHHRGSSFVHDDARRREAELADENLFDARRLSQQFRHARRISVAAVHQRLRIMAGNSFGTLFRLTTFGESHGPALGVVIDGCPPGMALDETDIQVQMDRRRPGSSRHTTQRDESDKVEILSGVFEGRTTGTPIALLIRNTDQRSKDYGELRERLRPNHADYSYLMKYGIRDHRGGGRSSARETAARVAAGAVARKYLESKGIRVRGCLMRMGDIQAQRLDWDAAAENSFFCPDADRIEEMAALVDSLREAGDSIGAEIMVRADGVPPGLGEPVYGRLDAELAAALMSINAVKGVGIGDGFAAVIQRGSEHRDEMTPQGFVGNHSGGVQGGISTGQPLIAAIAVKPTSSIARPGRGIDIRGEAVEISVHGRHDPCVGIRAVPVAEAMLALVLIDHYLRQRAQNADVVPPMEALRPASEDS